MLVPSWWQICPFCSAFFFFFLASTKMRSRQNVLKDHNNNVFGVCFVMFHSIHWHKIDVTALDWWAKQIHEAEKINSPVLPVYGSNWQPQDLKWTEKSRNHFFEWFATLHSKDACQKRNTRVYEKFFVQYCCTNTKTMYVDIAGDQENKWKKWNRRKTSILLF